MNIKSGFVHFSLMEGATLQIAGMLHARAQGKQMTLEKTTARCSPGGRLANTAKFTSSQGEVVLRYATVVIVDAGGVTVGKAKA